MNKFPCENCITYPICLSQVKGYIVVSYTLNNKCILFRKYFNIELPYDIMLNIYKYFGEWDHTKSERKKPKRS